MWPESNTSSGRSRTTVSAVSFHAVSVSGDTAFLSSVSRISPCVSGTRSVDSCLVFFLPPYGDITLGRACWLPWRPDKCLFICSQFVDLVLRPWAAGVRGRCVCLFSQGDAELILGCGQSYALLSRDRAFCRGWCVCVSVFAYLFTQGKKGVNLSVSFFTDEVKLGLKHCTKRKKNMLMSFAIFIRLVEGTCAHWGDMEKGCLHWSWRETGLPWAFTLPAWLSGEWGSVGQLTDLKYPALGWVLCRSWRLCRVGFELLLCSFNLEMDRLAPAPSCWINNLWRSELEAPRWAFLSIRKTVLLCCL